MVLSRRTLLRAAGVSGLIGVSAGSSARGSAPAPVDWKALDASLAGTVEVPGTTTYDGVRRLYDPRFDAVRPPAVARCANAADVAEVLRFARRSGVPVVPRGGGHSYVGASTSATGVMLDTGERR